MKKTFLLIALGALAWPTFSRAEPEVGTNAKRSPHRLAVQDRVLQKQSPNRVIIYITDRPRTGSNIPMTYRRYNGRIDSASSAGVYGSSALEATGAFDTGSALYRLDPSISFRR